jgi:hypothetical protein
MVWIQYSLTDGSQSGTDDVPANAASLAALGDGQIEYPGDPTGMMVDLTQNPPVVIPAPPSPSPLPAA